MRKFAWLIVALGVVGLAASPLYAGGFGITEKGVKGLGNAYSGGAAVAEDASTVWWNPAGMARLEKSEVDLAVFYIRPVFKFENDNTLNLVGGAIPGGDGGDAGGSNFVPNLFWAQKLSDRWSVGVSVVVPFGLGTEYDEGWVGRYHTIKSDILTVDINPAVSFRINDLVSIGGGISAQYLDAELTNAIDFGLIGTLGGVPGLTPSDPAFDGAAKLTGDSWGYGWNLGALFEITENARIGISYRSKVKHDVEGKIDYTDPLGIGAGAGLVDTDAKAEIELPDAASLSGYYRFGRWGLMGDVTWTGWSSVPELRIVQASGAADSVTTFAYDDTWRVSLGSSWYYSEKWTWRGGLAYDQTPVPNAELRTPRVPDEDRVWLTLGGGWKFAEAWSLDFAGGYIWTTSKPEIRKTATPGTEDQFRGGLDGDYEAYSILLGAQINFNY